jgi:hypothetical protein
VGTPHDMCLLAPAWRQSGPSDVESSPRVDIPAMSRLASLHAYQAEGRTLGRQGIMSLVKEVRTGDGGRHEALVVLLRTAVDGFDAVSRGRSRRAIGSC